MNSSRAIIIKHINAAADLQLTRFDDPNMPLDTTPRLVNPMPSKWRLTLSELTDAIAGGIATIRGVIATALRRAGYSAAFVNFLMALPDIGMDVLWAIGYSLIYPGTNMSEMVWDEVIYGFVWYFAIPTPVATEIVDAYDAVKARGLFVFGDIFAALERGWTPEQCLSWIIAIWKYDLFYHWPQTWDEAEGTIRDFEEIEGYNQEEPEDPEMLPGSWPGY